ncbi:MAG: ribonuclease P protein component [Deltaproteobacteria bacterium]|nr:ribonuclease P protein component [Deltaproteobacteria bacterium]
MKKYGFSKANRLLNRADFIQLSKNKGARRSRSVADLYFIIAFLPGQYDHNRLGITVTRRVGNAVVRNRIKRAAREAFRHNRFVIEGNWDLNVIAKKPSADISSGRLQASLKKLFSKIKGGYH